MSQDEDLQEFEEGIKNSKWQDWGFIAAFLTSFALFTTSLAANDPAGMVFGGVMTLFLAVVNAAAYGSQRKKKEIASQRKEQIEELKSYSGFILDREGLNKLQEELKNEG